MSNWRIWVTCSFDDPATRILPAEKKTLILRPLHTPFSHRWMAETRAPPGGLKTVRLAHRLHGGETQLGILGDGELSAAASGY